MKQNIIRQFSVIALSLCLLHSGTAFATEKKNTATHQQPAAATTPVQPQTSPTTGAVAESVMLPKLRMPTPILGHGALFQNRSWNHAWPLLGLRSWTQQSVTG